MKRRIRNGLWLLSLSGSLATIAALFQIGSHLLVPSQFPVGHPPLDLPLQEITFSNESGLQLSGWLLKRDHARRGILLMHGSGQNRAIMVPRARFLYEAGYSVFLFDFRAHGESDGRFRTFGIGEHEDAEAAMALLKRETGVQQTAVIGFSLGGAASILGDAPLDTDAFILEAVFPSIEAAVANRIQLRLGSFLSWTHPLLSYQIPLRMGIPLNHLRPIEKIGRISQPIFLIAGANDQRTTAQESRTLFQAITAKTKQFWLVPEANHTNFHAAAKLVYEQKVLDFLNKALEETRLE